MRLSRHRLLAFLLSPVLMLTAASWGGLLYRCHESGDVLAERCCDETPDHGLALEAAECCGVERVTGEHPVYMPDAPPAPAALPSRWVDDSAVTPPERLASAFRWMLPHDAGPPVLRRTCALLN